MENSMWISMFINILNIPKIYEEGGSFGENSKMATRNMKLA